MDFTQNLRCWLCRVRFWWDLGYLLFTWKLLRIDIRWAMAFPLPLHPVLLTRLESSLINPFIRELRKVVNIIIVIHGVLEGDKIIPLRRCCMIIRMYCFKVIIIDNMKLRTNIIGTKMTNQTNMSGM